MPSGKSTLFTRNATLFDFYKVLTFQVNIILCHGILISHNMYPNYLYNIRDAFD